MLRDDINNALKTAMKEHDKARLSTLRLINAAVKDRDIANRGEGKPAVDDAELQSILAKMIKQREESVKLYNEGGRPELAKAESDEIAVIREFLPRQLDENEVQKAIAEGLEATGAESLRDMGKVMSWLKDRYNGQMDFAKVGATIREKLK
ncbi:GatB/YqeY domain-containing protein [Bartonella sp. M0283]|uniref:GatB/YqeY domain-containing protein n=1 Tax=Bartonella sp. M0283 TaxID=2751016 RepID=UPI0018DDA6EE|nr:GatB/YqeY domain-containing protein [Bartonella sp. M0283]MBI0162351.1 GatB/YqeY domain-containing protein [Bartonella sp. M0283]